MKFYKLFVSQSLFMAFAIFLAFSFSPTTIHAQRSSNSVGIGFLAGQPTGLSVKVFNEGASFDFLAAWDLDQFFFLNVHALYDVHLNDAHTVHFFYGPGAFIGIRNRDPQDDDIALGISGNFGFDIMFGRVELFIQGTPRLELVKTTNFDMGGGVGMRFYF